MTMLMATAKTLGHMMVQARAMRSQLTADLHQPALGHHVDKVPGGGQPMRWQAHEMAARPHPKGQVP